MSRKINRHGMDVRREACLAYMLCGDSDRAGKLVGVPGRTIRDWLHESWWFSMTEQLMDRYRVEIDSRLTRVLDLALAELQDRLENGDEVVGKDGSKTRRRVSARDAALIYAITIDKRELLRGRPTSRTERVDLSAVRREMREIIEADS